MPRRGPFSDVTPEKRAAIIALLRAGKALREACRLAGTSRSAVNRAILKDPSFRQEIEANREPEKVLTIEARNQALRALANGAGELAAAKLIGVSPSGWRKLKQRDPTFQDEINENKGFADDTIQRSLYWKAKGQFTDAGACVREPDVRACLAWLSRRRPQEWGDALDPSAGKDLASLIAESMALEQQPTKSGA